MFYNMFLAVVDEKLCPGLFWQCFQVMSDSYRLFCETL